jgi:hypothetical protein
MEVEPGFSNEVLIVSNKAENEWQFKEINIAFWQERFIQSRLKKRQGSLL